MLYFGKEHVLLCRKGNVLFIWQHEWWGMKEVTNRWTGYQDIKLQDSTNFKFHPKYITERFVDTVVEFQHFFITVCPRYFYFYFKCLNVIIKSTFLRTNHHFAMAVVLEILSQFYKDKKAAKVGRLCDVRNFVIFKYDLLLYKTIKCPVMYRI
jgi:hypothetical protein